MIDADSLRVRVDATGEGEGMGETSTGPKNVAPPLELASESLKIVELTVDD